MRYIEQEDILVNPNSAGIQESGSGRRQRVIIYSPFFYPEPISTGRYNAYLAKSIVASGAEAEVVSSHPLYPDWIPRAADRNLTGISVHRGGLRVRYPKSDALRRVFLEMWFTWHALGVTLKARRRVDVAVFIFPPVLFAVICRLVMPRHVRTVGVVHDLQALMVGSGIVGWKGIAGRLVRVVEGYAIRKCSRVVCLSNAMAEFVVQRLGVNRERCEVCYPFANMQCEEGSDCLAPIFDEGRLHVVYSGALGKKQIPDMLLEFFCALCEKRSDIICHIFSRGPMFERLRRRKKGGGESRVRFHDLVPESSLEELYRRSDVQVIPQARGTDAAAFPSKLPNLLSAGVPVFAICEKESELSKVTLSCGGAVSSPDNVSGMVTDMVNFLSECKKETHEQRRVRLSPYTDKLFSISRLVDVIVSG